MLKRTTQDQQKVSEEVAQEVEAASKDPREILKSIFDRVHDLNLDDAKKVAYVQARFATLLVALSELAKKTTQENLKMQRKLVRLTWALFILTVALTLFAGAQLCGMLK